MDVTRLRAIMRRYKEAGVLLVGAYLVGHHLWTKRRIVLLTTPVMALVLACWMAGVLRGPVPAPQPSVSPLKPPDVRLAAPQDPAYYPQKLLLSHASKVTALGEDYFAHLWISQDRLLLVTSRKQTRREDDDSADEGCTEWQGQANLLDIRTGRRRKLEGLTRAFNHMHATPNFFETSPGEEWLMWNNRITGDGWPNPAVARWDGSGFQQWRMDKGSDTYWLDDHRWVEEQTHSYDEAQYPKKAFVHDADRHKTSVLKLKSKAGQKLVRAHYAACEHEFEVALDRETTPSPRVMISERISSDDDNDGVYTPPLRTYTTRMPLRADVVKVLVAPKTRRVLYVLHFRKVAEGQPQPKYGVFDLWSSRLDGSGLKELGYLETGALDYLDDEDPMTAQNMSNLEWLPDGKHFSFIYRKNLYRAAGY